MNAFANRERPRILAIEIEHNGHHPSYIRNFAETWAKFRIPGELKFLVTDQFMRQHQDEVQVVRALRDHGLDIQTLPGSLPERSGPRTPRDYWVAWKAFCSFAKDWDANHGLLMASDFFQLPVCLGQKSPCPLTAIYFRPTFHYGQLEGYRPSLKDRLKAVRKKWLLKKFLGVQQVSRVFSLDSLAVDFINQNLTSRIRSSASVEVLPDAFARFDEQPSAVQRIRDSLQVQPGREVLLLLGVLDRRKGTVELLQACQNLSPEAAKKICIVLVGRLADDCKQDVTELVARLQTDSQIQIVLRDQFIPENEVQLYYLAADAILATYQKHLGNSSALIRAALAEKPVLVSDYGLMGEIVKRRRLGRCVDTEKQSALTEGLVGCVNDDWSECFDLESARRFAAENTSTGLAECLKRLAATSYGTR